MKYLKIAFMLVAVLLIVGGYFFLKNKKVSRDDVKAGSAQESISSEAEWETGTVVNLDTATLPGSFSIDQKGTSLVSGGTFSHFQDPCVPHPDNQPEYIADGDTFTQDVVCVEGNYIEWIFTAEKIISQVRISAVEVDTDPFITPIYSFKAWDGASWNELFTGEGLGGGVYQTHNVSPSVQTTKIRIYHNGMSGAGDTEVLHIFEAEISSNATATHTSAATQIDGSEGGTKNFIEWETFTPTYSEPANTNVKFRFRTSADASNWTSWTDYQTPASGGAFDISDLVDSASGANKYLQVETTLENTDGASTPTVDSYSTGYHTNLAPSTPTNLTAVVGE